MQLSGPPPIPERGHVQPWVPDHSPAPIRRTSVRHPTNRSSSETLGRELSRISVRHAQAVRPAPPPRGFPEATVDFTLGPMNSSTPSGARRAFLSCNAVGLGGPFAEFIKP